MLSVVGGELDSILVFFQWVIRTVFWCNHQSVSCKHIPQCHKLCIATLIVILCSMPLSEVVSVFIETKI